MDAKGKELIIQAYDLQILGIQLSWKITGTHWATYQEVVINSAYMEGVLTTDTGSQGKNKKSAFKVSPTPKYGKRKQDSGKAELQSPELRRRLWEA